MVTPERGYCNWEYTGEYETNKNSSMKKTEWKTDCGKWSIGREITKSESYSNDTIENPYQWDRGFPQIVRFAETN